MFSTDKAEGNTQDQVKKSQADCAKIMGGCAVEGHQKTVAEHLDAQLAALNREIARVVTLKESLEYRVLQSPLSLLQQVVYGG